MSKRFATTCFIVLACVIVAFFVFAIALFLLPGISIFGLRYIGENTHIKTLPEVTHQTGFLRSSVETEQELEQTVPCKIQDIEDSNGDKIGNNFTGIIIKCYEMPIEIIFSKESFVSLKYYDNYNGVTSTKGEPSIKFLNDGLGNAVIDISEYKTFLYQSSNSKRFLKLYIPRSGSKKYNLTINSTKSPVLFSCDEGFSDGDIKTPANLLELTLNTNGKITYDYEIKATKFTYKTSKSIEITEDYKVDATSYTLESTDGKIIVTKNLNLNNGDLVCKTKLGKIMVANCHDLKAETTFGNIGYSGTNISDFIINGFVDITTGSGDITLHKVNGGTNVYELDDRGRKVTDDDGNYIYRKNRIKTDSGNIEINTFVGNGDIITERGTIDIGRLNKFTIKSNSGRINITSVIEGLNIEVVRSKVTLGDSNNSEINNISVTSTLGNIDVKSASGTVDLTTINSGNINFENKNSSKININCAGTLKATGLKGNVTITAKDTVEKIDIENFEQGKVEINLEKTCKTANINIPKGENRKGIDLSDLKSEGNYEFWISGKEINLDSSSHTAYSLQQGNRKKENSNNLLIIDGPNTVINLYYKNE